MGGGKDTGCGGCTKPVSPIVEPSNLQEKILEFRRAMGAQATDPSDLEALKLMMNTFLDKFEEFYNACGFTFDAKGDPDLPAVVVADQQGMIEGMVNLTYILIDWSLSYGWDFNKNFMVAHNRVMANLAAMEMRDVPLEQIMEVIEPPELNNTVGDEE